jgi:hypothetical protein
MEITILAGPMALRQAVDALAKACIEEIERSERPTDAFPLAALIPLFVVDLDHLMDWPARVPDAVWTALGRITERCYVSYANEAELRNAYYALDHNELLRFRAGTPILKIVSAIKTTSVFNVGGRTKHSVEVKIREALEFEVFRREIEIAALQSAKARLSNLDVVATRGAGLEYLRANSWVDGVPTKGVAGNKKRSKADSRGALFEALRVEGEKLAIKIAPGAISPTHVEDSIKKQVNVWAAGKREAAEFDDAIAAAALPIRILMKACSYVTAMSGEKHALAKAGMNADERARARAEKEAKPRERPRRKPLFPIPDPMTKKMHTDFSKSPFSPFELILIASAANIDPNLLSAEHALATLEFNLARKLRACRYEQRVLLAPAELLLLNELICAPPEKPVLYPQVRQFLTKLALELQTREKWAGLLSDLMIALDAGKK